MGERDVLKMQQRKHLPVLFPLAYCRVGIQKNDKNGRTSW